MTVVAIDHVQLGLPPGAEAVAAADAFYVGLLGFSPEPKPAALAARGGRWYRSGPVRVHLGVEHDGVPSRRAHPAFVVDDLDALTRTLLDAGRDVVADDAIADVRRAFTSDPFGNRIELIAQAG